MASSSPCRAVEVKRVFTDDLPESSVRRLDALTDLGCRFGSSSEATLKQPAADIDMWAWDLGRREREFVQAEKEKKPH